MTSAASTLRDASAPIAETGRNMGQATLRVQESLAVMQAIYWQRVTSSYSHALGEQLRATFETAQRIQGRLRKAVRAGRQVAWQSAFGRIIEQTNTSRLAAINGYVVNLDKHLGLGIDRFMAEGVLRTMRRHRPNSNKWRMAFGGSTPNAPNSTENAHEEDESYFVSMTDIMIGLVFIFVILLMFFAMRLQEATVGARRRSASDCGK